MTTYTVTTHASLLTAVSAAVEGDTVLLAPGRYAALQVSNKTGVTLASLDPARPAVVAGLTVSGGAQNSFSNLEIDGSSYKTGNIVVVANATDITFDKMLIHGSLDGNPQNDAGGMLVRWSDGVTVTNSRFTEVFYGIQHGWNERMLIEGNTFQSIRMDGIRGGGSSHVQIAGNLFTDFFPTFNDHMDAIQFWTAGTTQAATDITITNNLILRGRGAPVQGVFIGDEVGTLPFQNVRVEGNLVSGGDYHGITVSNARNSVLTNNVVVAWPDQLSWITANDGSYTLSGNRATGYRSDWIDKGVPAGNQLLEPSWDGGAALLAEWSAALPSTGYAPMLSAAAATSFPTRTISGGSGADTLSGTFNLDTYLSGAGGNDYLQAGAATTIMAGGVGDDRYVVRDLNDHIFERSGEGADSVYAYLDYTLPESVEHLNLAGSARIGVGNAGLNRITGGTLDDSLSGLGGADTLSGGSGADTLDGGTARDHLNGGDGSDLLRGGDDADLVAGGAGDDLLYGQNGNDSLDGGVGADRLFGGAGADIFVFRGADVIGGVERIEDFNGMDGDKISLGTIDANSGVAGDQAFVFLGTAAFTGKAGELRYEAGPGGWRVFGDWNGDGIADFEIFVSGATAPSAKDFWF